MDQEFNSWGFGWDLRRFAGPGIPSRGEDPTGNVLKGFPGVFWVLSLGIWDGKGSPWSPAAPRPKGITDVQGIIPKEPDPGILAGILADGSKIEPLGHKNFAQKGLKKWN